ncbi:hypothetical protein ACFYW6_07235 [Streptomyces sp. NPDC002659]|uniref:hypothetical protein n=1 Tax=Streptomyces sp. NPDC002659 TaxID=3364656 RepID=UPI003695EA2F
MQKITRTCYRFATDEDELPEGRVVDIIFGPDADAVSVVVLPGHATAELLDEISAAQESMILTGQWVRLESTPETEKHPRRVFDAGWRLAPADVFPQDVIIMSLERLRGHVWVIREGQASPQLVRDMTDLLTAMVRSVVWIQRGAGEDTAPADS